MQMGHLARMQQGPALAHVSHGAVAANEPAAAALVVNACAVQGYAHRVHRVVVVRRQTLLLAWLVASYETHS